MFVKVKSIFTVLFILFLLFVFTAPRAYLNQSCDRLLALADEAEAAEDPAQALETLSALYEEKAAVFRLFLDHGAVEEAGAAVAGAKALRNREALSSALSVLREAIEDLRRIETLDPAGLC